MKKEMNKESGLHIADDEHRSRVIDEATECLVQIGNKSAKDIVQAIIDGKIKHISINF
ncbi:MAG: hypothetical protein K2P74_04410 [Nitrosomonas sp.]|nr:hypothetical protein [Nitrosomonas sp.]